MRTVRIFDAQHDHINDVNPFPMDWHPMCEFNNVGNDSYHDWTVGLDYEEASDGGWLTPEIVKETDEWLLKAGAKHGEELLIKYWW